jgi:release factor glutamine methyltransferase
MGEIYQPAEDSFFFSKFLKSYFTRGKIGSYLDMGTGSGILPKVAGKFLKKDQIVAVDINLSAVKLLKKQGLNSTKSNLFSKIKGKFDLITFNAPYLPLDPREPRPSRVATTGGVRGDEISLKFIRQAKRHINKKGKIFLLVSSLTPMDKIKRFKYKVVARKKIFMEELLILEFT